jgi:hypothetical protein
MATYCTIMHAMYMYPRSLPTFSWFVVVAGPDDFRRREA